MGFTVLLDLSARMIAQKFSNHHYCEQKKQQVYYNTLAVYAVNYYLKYSGIETDCKASDSWNPVMQMLADTADLVVKDRGKLECRPVLPQANICYIPPEVWEERIGYVAVQFQQSLEEVKLLGFVPAITVERLEEFPIYKLDPLDTLLEHLSQPHPKTSLITSEVTKKSVVDLGQWLQGMFTSDWVTLEIPQIAFSFRSAPYKEEIIKRGKSLWIGENNEHLYLSIGLKPVDESNITICVEIHSNSTHSYLPYGVKLTVLDMDGNVVIEEQAKITDNCIKIELLTTSEDSTKEYFAIKVCLGDTCIIEKFVI